MNTFQFIVLLFVSCLQMSLNCQAKISSGLCTPYFVSLKVSTANLRVGPGRYYKIVLKYVNKGLPVLITAKCDHWRRITDPDGTSGWLHKSQLSTKRYVIITKNNVPLMSSTRDSAKVLATINKNVVMELKEIRGIWCKVHCRYNSKNFSGWVKKSDTFGTFDEELGNYR